MFSRRELQPGTGKYDNYYKRQPENKAPDDNFKTKPGLLKPGTVHYNPFHFAASESSFETIERLQGMVDGHVAETQVNTSPREITGFIKSWSQKLGALDCGITKLEDYHLYSVGGRGERYDMPISSSHSFAIAVTVEMDKTMIDSAPTGSIVMESGQQYLNSGAIAIQLAQFIRNIGYDARAHIDGNYLVVCPLVARDAGLGEIGRMGLLMTPKHGPRVRIAVVTTDLLLLTDQRMDGQHMISFCHMCKKCAAACPSDAISYENQKEIDGVKRWQISSEACYTMWCTLGTDCGRCISVCPFSHPDNVSHNFIRWGIRKSYIFRKLAMLMDDLVYGKKPPVADLPDWLQIR